MPTSSSATLKAIHATMDVETPVFANAKAKIAWEIGRQVSQITPSLPTEAPTMRASKIEFAEPHKTRGTYAVLFLGTVVGTEQEGVFVVPERTLVALQKMRIPYREI